MDILDGSPPCTTFSMAGDREKTWGKTKKFREGQKEQTLDDLFFVFLDTVEKLKPNIVIAENVTGIIKGNAKGYCNLIVKRFKELGYDLQIFHLNAAKMDVPQARERIFFIANNQGYGKLKLDFNYDLIPFGKVRETEGKEFYNSQIYNDELVALTVTSGGEYYRMCDKKRCTDMDINNVQTFPQDYNYCGNPVQYVCGMSVPPNMMANIATEVWNQWLK